MMWLLAMVLLAVSLTGPLSAAPTYAGEVAAILNAHCVACHHAGEAAPFALDNYADASKRAGLIAAVTARRYMPPWPPVAGHGEFQGERRLSERELATLADWAKAGAPAGELAQAPRPPQFASAWQLGPPDLIVRMAKPFRVPASGGDVFRNFALAVPIEATRYVRAMELRPGNKRVVHHANVIIDRTRQLRAREGKDGQPGFAGMDVETEAGNEFDPDSHFLFWKPGSPVEAEPDDMAWRLDPGSDLVINLHLQPTGKVETIQAEIGLYFSAQPPERFPMLVQLEHDGAIVIPPGQAKYTVEDSLRLPMAVDVLAIYPHAHYLGKQIEAWVQPPGGERRSILRIDDWDINWQSSYVYQQPLHLPAGTVLSMRIEFDNSAGNPRARIRPPQRVTAGNRSQDEMGHVWFQILPADPADRLVLQEAVMRRRLEKYPADFAAHYNLGAALQSRGQEAEAQPWLEKAVKLRPNSAVARNALATSLLANGKAAEAIAGFRKVLAMDPEYLNARVNLAVALAGEGDAAGAAEQLRLYLEKRPQDGRAQYLLAGIFASGGRYAEALPHFAEAARLLPDDAEILANYATVLALMRRPAEAVPYYERALALRPADAAIRTNLERARAEAKRGRP